MGFGCRAAPRLNGYANMNDSPDPSPRVGDEPGRYAVIDAGTNSIKFHIGERDAGGGWRTVRGWRKAA